MQRIDDITRIITAQNDVVITTPFAVGEVNLIGGVEITVGSVTLPFQVIIDACYPYHFHDRESIKFINEDLLDYKHVMRDGSICMHTRQCPNLEEKLSVDFSYIKQWIERYYINGEHDTHYEHLIVPEIEFGGSYFTFYFTELNHRFKGGDFGYIHYSTLSNNLVNTLPCTTHIVHCFEYAGKRHNCTWSQQYIGSKPQGAGIFIFLDSPPTDNGRFVFDSWQDFEPFFPQEFLTFIEQIKRGKITNKDSKLPIPLFIGYQIPTGETHWLCAAIDHKDFPNYGEKDPETKKFIGRLSDKPIIWLPTRDCSYDLFFGRGKMSQQLTDKKIMVVGIGALGSTIATALARGGCKNITFAEYDIKEPGNVCRSEYKFSTGFSLKTTELAATIHSISPFVEVNIYHDIFEHLKYCAQYGLNQRDFIDALNQFDYIFDCTADNDLAYILDTLSLDSKIINLSITNHATALVCTTSPTAYRWKASLYEQIQQDEQDLFNPSGCWTPTFKASYNDIALLAQFALKQINSFLSKSLPLSNFVLSVEDNGSIQIKNQVF